MTQKNTSERASRKGGVFDPKARTRSTMNFIGACLHTPMTPEAKKNIANWIESELKTANVWGWAEAQRERKA